MSQKIRHDVRLRNSNCERPQAHNIALTFSSTRQQYKSSDPVQGVFAAGPKTFILDNPTNSRISEVRNFRTSELMKSGA
uniref:MSP domain-containing protein n=1 Tax=Ascaris lumbricoides TaxID=6252 RepID=A0A0M3I4V5_ASCLU